LRDIARHGLVMRPALDDTPMLEDENLIGAPERAQTVGDHDRRPAGHEAPETCLMYASLSVSRFEVASSRMRIRRSASSARAIDTRLS